MEQVGLCPELQSIIDRFVNFRIEYTTLKAHHRAQEELIKLQKTEVDQMNVQVAKLSTTFIEWQKSCNIKLRNLETENQRLQKIIDNLKDQDGGALAHQARRQNETKISSLEEQLKKLQSQIDEENKQHREEIETINKNHEEEISMYKKKLDHCYSIEQRQNKEISLYKKKEIEEKKELQSIRSQINNETTHPALESNAKDNQKRKKLGSFKWPQLDIDLRKDIANNQQSASRSKKKKLYNVDSETIVDLTS
ncbi:uncharacterized protein MCAP_0864-like [Venturia canescens]|uniref:uncharacterized protein MCAP_0864-like n=1 Tax=Venturia canescens TaxID=32260 RepID=UPI001C9C6C57|nr:uncharacterized protein MCAP_0864-like [Venturia canescens]